VVKIAGWDSHYGNVVIVSSFEDTLHTIYMHLKGHSDDCDCMHAWADTIGVLDGPDPESWVFEEMITLKGCTREQALRAKGNCKHPSIATQGDVLELGDVVAEVGQSGPRGKLSISPGGANVRANAPGYLRVGVAVRVPAGMVVVGLPMLCTATDAPRDQGHLCSLI
jgi:hypothetical protein